MIELLSGCLRCKRDFRVDEVDSAGYPLHVHYCNECCKRCEGCGKFFIITHFLPILDHPSYKDWLKGVTNVHEEPLGLLLGRDLVDDLCIGCKPFRPLVVRIHPLPVIVEEPESTEPPEEDGMAKLERLLAARRSQV